MPSEISVIRAALKASPEAHDKLREMVLSGKLGSAETVPNIESLTIIAAPDHFGIEGSKQARCGCGLIVWINPSTQAMLLCRDADPQAAPTRVLCAWCFMKELRATHATQRTQ